MFAGFQNYTHGFVCDKLMGEKLDWRMVVARRDQGVFRVCVHELGESRVDEAYVLSFGHSGTVGSNRNRGAFFWYTFS